MPAFATRRKTSRLTMRLITSASTDLVEEPLPPRPREEVRYHRSEPLGRRPEPLVDVVLAPRLVGPVDQERPAFHVVARQEAPVAAVLRVVAIVPHHEVLVGRDRDGSEALAHVE